MYQTKTQRKLNKPKQAAAMRLARQKELGITPNDQYSLKEAKINTGAGKILALISTLFVTELP